MFLKGFFALSLCVYYDLYVAKSVGAAVASEIRHSQFKSNHPNNFKNHLVVIALSLIKWNDYLNLLYVSFLRLVQTSCESAVVNVIKLFLEEI